MKTIIKQVNDKFTIEESNGVLLKTFYAIDEKSEIYNSMLVQSNALMCNMALVVGTAKVCTNIDFDEMKMNDKDIYDFCAENGFIGKFKSLIADYDDMNKLVEMERSAYKAIDELFDKLSKSLDGFDTNKLIDEFKNVAKEGLK